MVDFYHVARDKKLHKKGCRVGFKSNAIKFYVRCKTLLCKVMQEETVRSLIFKGKSTYKPVSALLKHF